MVLQISLVYYFSTEKYHLLLTTSVTNLQVLIIFTFVVFLATGKTADAGALQNLGQSTQL